jgi:hypothetical protein
MYKVRKEKKERFVVMKLSHSQSQGKYSLQEAFLAKPIFN